MELAEAIQLGLALGLGLLVGFQREWAGPHVAGLRTVTLLTLLGTVLGLLSERTGHWLIIVGLAAVTAMVIMGTVLRFGLPPRATELRADDPGLTTQAAALLMYMVGVIIAQGRYELAVVLAGLTASLLHWKEPLHDAVARFDRKDLRAIVRLVLIALVILPILPNQDYGPYGVLNPFEIWLMVVLIVGISLVAYIVQKFLGARAGSLWGGVLGGLISSTATTASAARRAGRESKTATAAAFICLLATVMVFLRVGVEIALVAPAQFRHVIPPLATLMGVVVVVTAIAYYRGRQDLAHPAPEGAPSEFKVAVLFGLVYAGVLLAVAYAQQNFGARGAYVVAVLSGLTDMDAITLSTMQLIRKGDLPVDVGWRMVVVAMLSNTVFKLFVIAALGGRALLMRMLVAFGVVLVAGGALLVLWPPIQVAVRSGG